MNKVVVTGLGTVTPLGPDAPSTWREIRAGSSGAGPVTSFDTTALPVKIAAEAKGFDPTVRLDRRQAARLDRFAQMAVTAAVEAWEAAEVTDHDPSRSGVVIGSGIGGLITIVEEHLNLLSDGPRRVSPFMVPKLMPNGASAAVAMQLGLTGPNMAVASACATGAHAIGEAARMIERGDADLMLCGGAEAAITPLAMAAFARMGALSTRNDDPVAASRPFDADRDGFVFGEGAGVLVLESEEHARQRSAPILGRIVGYGSSCDAHHATQPDPEGRGAIAAMSAAMEDAGVAPAAIDYINAHGTSTPYNDRIESHAIREVFGVEAKATPVSSTKSQLGHLLGAAGAVEAAICLLAMRDGIAPATINLSSPDPDCDLDHVTASYSLDIEVALSNSFGFGGQNACLVMARG
ncbi:MAG: beta-ketoacyl-ACP synthase II [Actinomycetota bacterium]